MQIFPSHIHPVEQVEHANISQKYTPGGTGGTSGTCKYLPAISTWWNRWNMGISFRNIHPVEQVEQVEQGNISQKYTPRGTGGTRKYLSER